MSYSNRLPLLVSILLLHAPSRAVPRSKKQAELKPIRDILNQSGECIETLLKEFLSKECSPTATFNFERDLKDQLRELGRQLVESIYNRLEGDNPDALPSHLHHDSEDHRIVKQKTARPVDTVFGAIKLWRHLYRPASKHSPEAAIAPLEKTLGVIANTTPALAEVTVRALAGAGANQRSVLKFLKTEHQVTMGAKRLRALAARYSEAMAETRQEFQVQQIVKLLDQAEKSRGRYRPSLSVGRDGVSLRKNEKDDFEMASTATVAVFNRKKKRLGTVYLARTSEPHQLRMTEQLTALLDEVLRRWQGPLPRLAYVTDAGKNETQYYDRVLKSMKHPRTGKLLPWVRVLDFYHAMERIWTMAAGLFGKDSPQGCAWARKMAQLLKKPNGPFRVLHSAAALESSRGVPASRQGDYRKAYNYLRKRTRWMQYHEYGRRGLPLGSGITEAACKTVYAQRLKLSGMQWENEGAQVILDLRVVLLSGIWDEVYRSVLKSHIQVELRVCSYAREIPLQMAC